MTRRLGPPRPGSGLPNTKNGQGKSKSPGLHVGPAGQVWATLSALAELQGCSVAGMRYRFKKYGMTRQTGVQFPHDRTAARYHLILEHTAEVLGVDWQKILDWKAQQQ